MSNFAEFVKGGVNAINYSYKHNGEEQTIESLAQLKDLLEAGVLSEEDEVVDKDTGSSVIVKRILEPPPQNNPQDRGNSVSYDNGNSIDHTVRKRPFKAYIIPGIFIFAGIIIALLNSVIKYPSDLFHSNSSYAFGYRLGAVFSQLVVIAIFWPIAWALTRKRKTNGPLVFSIIYLTISIITFTTSLKNQIEINEQNSLCEQKLYSMVEDAAKGLPITDEVFTEEKYGKQYQVLNSMRDMMKDSYQISAEMQNSIEETQIGTILTAQVLGDPKEISAARERLKITINKMDEFETKFLNIMDSFVSEIDGLDLSEEYKRGIIEGYLGSSGSNKEVMKSFYQIERDILASVDDILLFLQSKEGKYSFDSDTILFETDEDVAHYNRLFQTMQMSIDKETELVNKRKESLDNKMSEFKEQLK